MTKILRTGPVKADDGLRVPLESSPACVRVAWRLVETRLVAWGWGEDLRYDAHLVLAELVSNAVAVTPAGQCITVHCHRDGHGVTVGVGDPCPDLPHTGMPLVAPGLDELDLRAESFNDNGGWGLTVIDALADRRGVTPLGSGGKVVWARLKG